ncbi:MAG: MOSC domain-containing protein [Thermoleophilia bacterium]|nr:MOSC domain-containing protein [Thermoleophilia bacterium]
MSGHRKVPVPRVDVRDPGLRAGGLGSGVVGDAIGNATFHGGDTQAVYAFAREELDWWQRELGREIANGGFGENVTTAGLDVDAALVGERWRVGGALLEVCGPRKPCATFALRMGIPGWIVRFGDRGRSGAYLAVVEPGAIATGDAVDVVHRPDHDVDMMRLFRALHDPAAARAVLAVGCLRPPERERVERVAAKG